MGSICHCIAVPAVCQHFHIIPAVPKGSHHLGAAHRLSGGYGGASLVQRLDHRDCEISDSRCSGISLGKYLQPENENKWTTRFYKDGTQTERDAICQAQREGWTKENIGSHIVRRCNIHHCGQTGIVGHLGGVFSLIEDNHIHHINNKQDLAERRSEASRCMRPLMW